MAVADCVFGEGGAMFGAKPKPDGFVERFDKEVGGLNYALEAEHESDRPTAMRVRTFSGDLFKFRAFFFLSGAAKDRVTSAQLFAAFDGDPKPAKQSEWNRHHRFIKAYSHEKQLNLEMDFSTLSLGDDDLRFYLQTWHRGLQQARDFAW